MKLIISRQIGKELWDIKKILTFFKIELEAREKVDLERTFNEKEQPLTGTALLTSESKRNTAFNRHKKFEDKKFEDKCLFCGRDHYSRTCSFVTKPDMRKTILFKDRRCFKCFKSRHNAAQCRSNIKCFKCEGKHHTSICTHKKVEKDERDNDKSLLTHLFLSLELSPQHHSIKTSE